MSAASAADGCPLVSCIMPTADRRAFVPRAIGQFLDQDYPNRELVIVDDGEDPVADLIPDDPRINYRRRPGRLSLGAKRNECVRSCQGELIMHWDDDDWMAPRRIRVQVEALQSAGAEVCGLRKLFFHEPSTGRTWLYEYPVGEKPWLVGGTLLYTLDFWRRSPFPAVATGEDTRFLWSRPIERVAEPDDHTFYVALIHRGNCSPKQPDGLYWSEWRGDVASLFERPTTPLLETTTPSARESRERRLMKLNLGCRGRLLPDHVNVDSVPGQGIEVVDLRAAWPWPESSVDSVLATDIVEHLPDKIRTMNELWRVLKPGGRAELQVPTTDGTGAFQDPTHLSFWNRRSFLYYEDGNPYRERLAVPYGITARFRTIRESIERTIDGPRLTIVLEAIKS